jgi:gamma-glutamyl-gamma-aminobutyraldehyde dehydrogenase
LRKAVLLRVAERMAAAAEELALLDTLDMGRPISESLGDVPGSVELVRWYAEAIDKVYGEVAPTGAGSLALVRREPLGVVGAVSAWNFPLSSAVWKLAPALAAGNSVVLKPSATSPLSALRLASLAAEAGLPPGVLNVVPGRGDVAGRALGEHPDVDVIAFTGSGETGRRFLSYSAGSNGKPVWIEGGGKSPALVLHDADLDAAARAIVGGITFNQGQVCSANSRVLVDARVAESLGRRVAELAAAITPGDPLDPATRLGALASPAQTEAVLRAVEAGRRTSRLLAGGERRTVTSDCFVTPTVFAGVAPDDPLARDEVFGPVVAILSFDTEAEAIALANASRFGLAASVWTKDLSAALRVADALRAGTVSVNTVNALHATTPFGGFGESGYGRDLSLHALEKYTGLKTTWIRYEA